MASSGLLPVSLSYLISKSAVDRNSAGGAMHINK